MNLIILNYDIEECKEYLVKMAKLLSSNLKYIYGDDMDNEEDREKYISYHMESKPFSYLIIDDNNELIAFMDLEQKENSLSINEIQIKKDYQLNPIILRQFIKEIKKKYDMLNISCVYYCINKCNNQSMHNFEKLACEKIELKNSYKYILDLNHPFVKRIMKK